MAVEAKEAVMDEIDKDVCHSSEEQSDECYGDYLAWIHKVVIGLLR